MSLKCPRRRLPRLPPRWRVARADLAAGRRAVRTWRGQTLALVQLPALARPASAADLRLAVVVQPLETRAWRAWRPWPLPLPA